MSVAVRSLHTAVLARLSREIFQVVRHSFLSRVGILVRPNKFLIGEKSPKQAQQTSVQLIARSRLMTTGTAVAVYYRCTWVH